jgi:hypothetical protein
MKLKKILLLFYFFSPFVIVCQETNDENLDSYMMKIELKELPNRVINTGGGIDYTFSYRGALVDAAPFIMNIHRSRVRVNGIPPNKYIYCEINTPYNDISALKDLVLHALMKKYKFKTSFVQDTCEVWVLKQTNLSKLKKARAIISNGGGPKDEYTWVSEGERISFLAEMIEEVALVIVYEEKPDDNIYDFVVPLQIAKSFYKLNEYLCEKYGISVVRKKKIERLLQIDFF